MLCCNAFENLITNAGKRGLGALISENKDGVKFSIQMRAVTFVDETNFPKVPLPTIPTNIALSESMRICYCPFCGKKLDDLVVDDAQFFKEFAVKHKTFQNNWG